MPIYEYQCSKCSERHEAIQGINDAPVAHCPKCGGDVRKLFSSPAIQFKGSGFYKTDYPSSTSGRGGSGNSEGAKSEGSSGSDAGGGTSESKSETKSETKSESAASSSKPDAKAAS